MKQDFDPKNVKKLEIVLCKVNAERIEKTPPEIDLAIKREDNYSILDQKEDSFSLKLNSEIFVEPEALFYICLEYRINYELSHKVTKEFIENNIEIILQPAGSEISYMISTLTKFFTHNYFVMPPTIFIKRENSK